MKKTGVYAIRHIVSGKFYVGSAASSFRNRWQQHRKDLGDSKHDNSYLQAAWDKYGETAFEFFILEECPSEQCVTREQFWIDSLRAAERPFGYNLSPTAGSVRGIKHSLESRAKQSEACRGRRLTEETKRKISEVQTGRKLNDAWCKAVSDGLKGRKRVFSESWRKAMSESRKGKPKSQEHVRKIVETKRNKRLAREALRQQDQISMKFVSDDED